MLSLFGIQANAEGWKRKLGLVPGSMVLWFNNFLIIFNLICVYCGQIIFFVRTQVLCILIRKNLTKHLGNFFTSKLDTRTSYSPILCKLDYGFLCLTIQRMKPLEWFFNLVLSVCQHILQ